MVDGTQPQAHHYTPPWLDAIATHVVPSAMIAAEWAIMTLFFLVTSVRHPYSPSDWSYVDVVMVAVSGFVGLAMAGLALKLSGIAAESLATSHYVKGGFVFLIVLVLGVIETWAGIVERAQTIGIGPADVLLSDYTGIDAFRHIPTSVFIVSFILPCLVLGYGWASRPPVVESLAEKLNKQALALADETFKAKRDAIRAGRAGSAFRALRQSATGKQDEQLPAGSESASPEESAPVTGGKAAKFSASKVQGKKTARQWTSQDLKAYVAWAYDRELDDITAGNMIRSLGGNKQLTDMVGKPFYANNLAAKGWADSVYGGKQSEQEPLAMGD